MPQGGSESAINVKAILLIAVVFIVIGILIKLPELGITGMAGSQTTTLTIGVTGSSIAQVTYVSPITSTSPLENMSRTITFNTILYDPDGVADLNDSSIFANFSKSGDDVRYDWGCSLIGDILPYRANYSCSITMWYWDGSGSWTIAVSGTDLGNKTRVSNTSTQFTWQLLKAMVISPTALTWPGITPSAINQTSNNDPTYINNTGNYNGTINMTAIDVYGVDTNYRIAAENFTVWRSTTGLAECGPSATVLVNATATVITGTSSNRGNLSQGSGLGQETFYYCIPKVPSLLKTQEYSTTTGGPWTLIY